MLFIRLCCALVSVFIVTMYLPRLVFDLLWSMRCRGYWTTACEEVFDWFNQLTPLFMLFVACLWIVSWVYFEIITYTEPTREKPRVLTHLRYGPIAVVVLSIAILLCYDMVMIQYSRWQIVRYIHSNASPLEELNLNLHNDYRSFCGNGMSAHRYALYGATPAEYIDDPDPLVRARAVKASIYVSDRWNHPGDGPSSEVLKKALADENALVRQVAAGDLWATP